MKISVSIDISNARMKYGTLDISYRFDISFIDIGIKSISIDISKYCIELSIYHIDLIFRLSISVSKVSESVDASNIEFSI